MRVPVENSIIHFIFFVFSDTTAQLQASLAVLLRSFPYSGRFPVSVAGSVSVLLSQARENAQ